MRVPGLMDILVRAIIARTWLNEPIVNPLIRTAAYSSFGWTRSFANSHLRHTDFASTEAAKRYTALAPRMAVIAPLLFLGVPAN